MIYGFELSATPRVGELLYKSAWNYAFSTAGPLEPGYVSQLRKEDKSPQGYCINQFITVQFLLLTHTITIDLDNQWLYNK